MAKEKSYPANICAIGANLGVQFHLVSAREAAQLLNRSLRTIRSWQAEGKMPPRIKVGRLKGYRIEQVLLMIESEEHDA